MHGVMDEQQALFHLHHGSHRNHRLVALVIFVALL